MVRSSFELQTALYAMVLSDRNELDHHSVLLLTIKKVHDRRVHGESTINAKQHAHVDELADMTVKPFEFHAGHFPHELGCRTIGS
jgi:hypothetical protein